MTALELTGWMLICVGTGLIRPNVFPLRSKTPDYGPSRALVIIGILLIILGVLIFGNSLLPRLH
jgi:hypothetical protein